MTSTHFMLLPDIVLLEIFSYLSSEDVLYAFGNLHDFRLLDLLTEYGAFRQICLSSQLSRYQYQVLSKDIWRYDLVRSFVCKEMFSDYIIHFTPCQIFTSLTELRIFFLRCLTDDLAEFVIAHSSTLTHLSVKRSEQAYIPQNFRTFSHTVLPHLNRLKLLDTDLRCYVWIHWSRLTDCLQSLEHLSTYVESMSDVYTLAVDGFFPCLQSLHIYVHKSVIKTVSTGLPAIANLHMPNLETFYLYVKKQGKANEGEEQVEWATLETLTSHSVMPRLRRYSLIYNLSTSVEIQHIFQSSLFNNDKRHIRIQFALHINSLTSIDLSDIIDICDIHSTHYNNIFVQYNDEDKSKLHYTLFTSSWPSWTIFWMNHHNVAPRSGVHQLGIKSPNISLHSLGKLCSDANELVCQHPASFSMVDSLIMAPTPLINLRCLEIHNVVPGLELLFDGNMLPRLHSLRGLIIPLFVAFASRANQMKTLDTVDHLAITDQG
ncbi:unnamed protein product, partial [Rotaria sp. Silwood1]